MYNLFLDDRREPHKFLNDYIRAWVVVRTYSEFCKTITEQGLPGFVSYDHDLADEHYVQSVDYTKFKERTGYDCAKWLVEYCERYKVSLPQYQVHSMNPVGKENIISLLENYKKSKS